MSRFRSILKESPYVVAVSVYSYLIGHAVVGRLFDTSSFLEKVNEVEKLESELKGIDPFGSVKRAKAEMDIYNFQKERKRWFRECFGSLGPIFHYHCTCPLKQDPNARVISYLKEELHKKHEYNV